MFDKIGLLVYSKLCTYKMDLQSILNKRFGLRNLLQQPELRTCTTSISPEDVLPDKEPQIRDQLSQIAEAIVSNPSVLFKDPTTPEERQADYISLLKKEVSVTEPLDSRSRPGHLLLDAHMPHFWTVRNWKGNSVAGLATHKHILEKALMTNLRMHTTPYVSEIRRTLCMVGGLSNVTKYRAPLAKAIVQWSYILNPGAETIRVLDPCIGWGGRMIGALAAGSYVQFVGTEPCKETFQGLQNILADCPKEAAARVHIDSKTGETFLDELLQNAQTFDMVLTSPPYYNLELYSDEPTQSINTYPTWSEWLTEWLEPLIARCNALLKEGGTSCWSVKNVRTDHEYNLADEVHAIHRLHGWELVQTVKMIGSARPGGGRIQNGEETRFSEEETFCFRKAVVAAH